MSSPIGCADHHERRPRREHTTREAARPHQSQRRQREREPLHVARPTVQRALEVRVPDGVGHARSPEEPVLRRVERQARGTDRHREQAAGEDPAAAERGEGHPPRVAPPAALATREGPRGHSCEHERADQEELRMRETAPAERDRGQDGAPRRAERQADRRRDERSGEREVREVPGREVHREQSGEQPGEHPGRANPPALSGHGARRADEHRRARADRRAERRLEPGGDRGDGQVRDPRQHREERGAPRAFADERQPLRRADPRPPEVDGDIGADAEAEPVPDERCQQHGEDDERQTSEPREVGAGARRAAAVRRLPRGAERALSVDDGRAVLVGDAGARERPFEDRRFRRRHDHVASAVVGCERSGVRARSRWRTSAEASPTWGGCRGTTCRSARTPRRPCPTRARTGRGAASRSSDP